MDKKWVGLLAGVAGVLITLLLPLENIMPYNAKLVVAVTVLIVIFWITQPIPIEATSLIPLVAFPLLGILSVKEAALPYADNIIILFLGGFIIAKAMEYWNLHKRIALNLIKITGTSPSKLILGFMIATAFLSMWMSNSATAVMMIPIAVALISTLIPNKNPKDMDKSEKAFAGCMVIGVAYAAGVGGIGTLIGTPCNAICASVLTQMFPGAEPITFLSWLTFGVPFVAIMIVIMWVWLTKVAFRKMPKTLENTKEILQKQTDELGPMSRGEKNTLIVFILAAFMWIFREEKDLGSFVIPGLNSFLPFPIEDCTIAIFCAILLFLIPVNIKKREFTMNWKTAVKIPWGILILFGAGMSISAAFKASGLSEAIGKLFVGVEVPLLLMVFIVALVVAAMTQIMSNVAVANIMIPVMAGVSVGLACNPIILMVTVAVTSSLAFLFPVSAAPNAVAFSTGYFKIKDLMNAGWFLILIGITLVTVLVFTIGLVTFHIDLSAGLPDWATLVSSVSSGSA